MEAIGYLGLAGSVALLIWMALRGVDIMFAAILSSLFVIITNALPLADSLMNGFATGHWARLHLPANFSSCSLQALFLVVPWATAVPRRVSPWLW